MIMLYGVNSHMVKTSEHVRHSSVPISTKHELNEQRPSVTPEPGCVCRTGRLRDPAWVRASPWGEQATVYAI